MQKKLLYTLICIFCLIGCTNDTKVQSVRLDPSELTLNIGETRQIEMLIEPISAIIYNPVAWHTSDPNVAQVDANGNVTAIYTGECTITGKTKHHEDHCHITVIAPEYNLTFTNGIIFDEGIITPSASHANAQAVSPYKQGDKDKSYRNLILRLYDNNLTIDSTGTMSGNGLFLNINLYAPSNSEQLPIGTYKTSDTVKDFTILPGALRQEGNSYYATGSYFGQFTDNGLSALFLTKGEIIVENNGSYSIVCSFIGAQTEKVEATFNGSIDIYDTSQENQVTIIEYTNITTEPIELAEEPTLNHIKISLSNNDTIVTFVARTPKSINTLPEGNYYSNEEQKAYTLITSKCNISTTKEITNIVDAILQVRENQYQATFTDDNGVKYLLKSTKSNENIIKQKVKTFVY